MISIEDIKNLATLARLKLSPDEEASLQKDISNILDYVGQVSAASVQGDTSTPGLSKVSPSAPHNVMRDDLQTPTLGNRDALLNAFPKREGDFNVVRKIIEKDAGAQ